MIALVRRTLDRAHKRSSTTPKQPQALIHKRFTLDRIRNWLGLFNEPHDCWGDE